MYTWKEAPTTGVAAGAGHPRAGSQRAALFQVPVFKPCQHAKRGVAGAAPPPEATA